MKHLAGIFIITIIVSGASLSLVAVEDKPAISVEGLRVVTKGYEGQENFRSFMWNEGSTISLMLYMPDGGIVGFEPEKSKIEYVKDDKGNDLMKSEKKKGYVFSGFDSFPKKSDDSKAILIDILCPGVPQSGSSAIELKGTIAVSVGSKVETFETKDLAIEVGAKIKTGGEDLEVERIGKGWGDYEYSFSLKGKGLTGSIKSIKLFDEDGKEIEMSSSGSSFYGNNFNLSYQLKKKVTKATVKVEGWVDLKTVEVPFDIKTGVGIGK